MFLLPLGLSPLLLTGRVKKVYRYLYGRAKKEKAEEESR
jgi:hypothetical protein